MELFIPPNTVLQRAELLGRILVLHWTDAHRSELAGSGAWCLPVR